MLFSFTACAKNNENEHGDPNANANVPGDSIEMKIDKNSNGKTVLGIGAEVDPHFFSQNVGLSGTTNGKKWEVKEEDWQNVFVPRIKEMEIQRFRTMLLPSWFVKEATDYKNYKWNTPEMKSLYMQLDTCMELGISVNITMWGIDKAVCKWLAANNSGSDWCVEPDEDKELEFVTAFADCIKYLIEEKGYTCIKEITLFNEPNAIYVKAYGSKGNSFYTDLCLKMNTAFKDAGIRDKVLFNLSDDARSPVWLGQTVNVLEEEGAIDIANSHSYDWGTSVTNRQMLSDMPGYNMKAYLATMGESKIPHMYGEFGTNTTEGSHSQSDRLLPSRGTAIGRIVINMFNAGSVGCSYWPLFSQYYNRSDFAGNYIMNMGLWGFKDEDYNCRPVYYAYSLITKYVKSADLIYAMPISDDYVVGVAFRSGDKWTYLISNDSTTSKKISFLNNTKFPSEMNKYLYDENDVPTNNKVIASSGKLACDGRVLTDTIPGKSFIVYSNR